MSDAPLPSSFDGDVDFYNENRIQKFGRRLKEEPLIPFGIALTGWALYNAQQSIRSGNSVKTNRYFRYRLYAQSFTLVAMIAGSLYYQSDRFKRKEYVKLKEKRKAQEKREKWIKELEVRDQEDKEWRAKLGKVQDLQREEEERLAVEEMRHVKDASEDGKGVLAEVRKDLRQKGGVRGKEAREITEFAGPVVDRPAAVQECVEQEPEKKFVSVLGEGEKGGLLGLKRLKTFYEDRIKPALGGDGGKKEEEENKVKEPGMPKVGDEQQK